MKKPLRRARQLNNKSGFTLAEVLITLAIMSVLLFISLVGINYYMNNLKVTEMDGNAKQIYLAAQNHLSAIDASGKLKDYAEESGSNTITVDGKTYSRIIYTTVNGNTVNLESSVLKDMLPFGSIDETIRTEGSYVIEYDYDTAQIFSVFYCDEPDKVTYDAIYKLRVDGGTVPGGAGKIARRDFRFNNQNFVIGFYGGTEASKHETAVLEEPEVEVLNEEKLQVKITDLNYFRKTPAGNQYATNISVSVEGEESKKTRDFVFEINDSALSPSQKLAGDYSADNIYWTIDSFSENGERYPVYTLTLDSVEEGLHFKDIFAELIPGEDLNITVTCTSKNVLTVSKAVSAKTNSLFAARKESEDLPKAYTAVSEYVRHLENLNPAVSGIPTETGEVISKDYTVKKIVNAVSQNKDIDFEHFKEVYEKDNATFSGIDNEKLKDYQGNNYTLSNFIIDKSGKAGESAGFFNHVYNGQQLEVKNLVLEGFIVKTETSGTGNAGALTGTCASDSAIFVSRVIVKDSVIKSGGSAGGLIGKAEGSSDADIEYCGVYRADKASSIDAKGDCGGFIGRIAAGNSGNWEITDSMTAGISVTSEGAGDAGGFVGKISSGNIKVKNSYSGGFTDGSGVYSDTDYNSTAANGNAGGFIGGNAAESHLTINNCFSTYSVTGVYSGGFAGKDSSSDSRYSDCYSIGLVGGTNKGAFAGVLTGNADNCKFLLNINFEGEEDMNAIYSGGSQPINGLSYSELTEEGNPEGTTGKCETHRYDNTNDGKYPFKSVNGTATAEKKSKVFYGDWQN